MPRKVGGGPEQVWGTAGRFPCRPCEREPALPVATNQRRHTEETSVEILTKHGTHLSPLIWDYALAEMFFLPLRMQKLLLVYCYSENRATSRIWNVLPNMVFSRFGGKKWWNSEHAHASYPELSFRPPGFSPYMGQEERRVQGLDYSTYLRQTSDKGGRGEKNCLQNTVATLLLSQSYSKWRIQLICHHMARQTPAATPHEYLLERLLDM